MPDFIPRKDGDLLSWSSNLSTQIASDPGAFGVSADLSAALVAAQDAFGQAYLVATTPLTRSPVNINGKDVARGEMIEVIRQVARVVRATPSVNGAMRIDLGLGALSSGLTRSTAPADAPGVTVTGVNGSDLRVELRMDAMSFRRCKPKRVAGAAVFVFLGDEPPTDLAQWAFAGNFTGTRFQLQLGSNVPAGTKVSISAYWLSTRAERGPASRPIYAYTGHPTMRLQSIAA